MTNAQIIMAYKVENGVREELHTFNGWKALGYKVKPGEHSKHKFHIWKFAERTIVHDDGTEENKARAFMKLSAFFTPDQVEPATR